MCIKKSSRKRAVCQFTFGKAAACWDWSFDICFLAMLLARRCTDMLNLIEVSAISMTGSDFKTVTLLLVSQRQVIRLIADKDLIGLCCQDYTWCHCD